MEHKDVFILEDIIKYCDLTTDAVKQYGNTSSNFKSNIFYQEICAFHAIQIGELANALSNTFTMRHPEIPWAAIRGLRNNVAHEYGNIEMDSLWETVTEDFPALRKFCAKQIGVE